MSRRHAIYVTSHYVAERVQYLALTFEAMSPKFLAQRWWCNTLVPRRPA